MGKTDGHQRAVLVSASGQIELALDISADEGVGAGEPRVASGERDLEVGVGFFRGGTRPPTDVVVDYVDDHRDEFGVESICSTLQIAPSTYYAARRRRVVPSDRAVRDAVMIQVLMVLWVANKKVYGAHKLWKAARRAGHDLGRDQTARLMRAMEIKGVSRRRKPVFTTRPDPDASRAPDLVNRNFTADQTGRVVGHRPDLRADQIGDGLCVFHRRCVLCRRIVGWTVASNMRTQMVLDALEMARRSRGSKRLVGLVTHSDAGSQFTSVRFTERLDEIGARPSIGTVANSYDNALAETVNGLYKAECVYGPDANGWDDVDQLELETLSWVHWFNHDRLHSHCDDVPPAEFETVYYDQQQTSPIGVGNQ